MNKFKTALAATLVAVAAIGCGVAPDETVTTDTAEYAPTAPVGPTIDPTVEIVYDFTPVCIADGYDHPHDYRTTDGKHNVYEPLTMRLIHEGALGNPSSNKRYIGGDMFCAIIEPEPLVCAEDEYFSNATGLCETIPTITVDPTITGTNKTPAEPFGFTVTPGLSKVDVAFDAATDNMTNYYVRDYAEGSYSASSTFVKYKTSFTYLRSNCAVREYQLVAKYADGSSVETSRIAAKPSNCE